ncbi:MAG: aromatic ring-hydroxylating dioxygenase subunit alpha [Actinomycetota bacterium]
MTTSVTPSVDPAICTNTAILDRWHPIAPRDDVALGGGELATQLLGVALVCRREPDGNLSVRRAIGGELVETIEAYGCVWACLGTPVEPLFAIDEVDEHDRRIVHAGTVGVHVSAPRAVENFLDMAHFPYVHTGILGEEPFTSVNEYDVHVDPDTNDVWATDCEFWQPLAATTSTTGQMTDYLYRVPHPFNVILYKTTPVDPERMDVIALFCQPVAPDRIIAHPFLCLLDADNTVASIRAFQLKIFGQDKPILENQVPKCLPLDPRAERPIRADRVAITYRRWLSDLGVTYGVIPTS